MALRSISLRRRSRRSVEHFPEIITRLAGMAEPFATALDCADIGFLPDGFLDQLPLPSQLGATRTGGIDLNKPRIRAALSAALHLLLRAAELGLLSGSRIWRRSR